MNENLEGKENLGKKNCNKKSLTENELPYCSPITFLCNYFVSNQ